jgi:hypothetical protein
VCAVSANDAAGRSPGPIEMADIEKSLETGMTRVRAILEAAIGAPA